MINTIKKLKSKVFINNLVEEIGINNANKLINKINDAIEHKKENDELEKLMIAETKEALKNIKKELKKAGLSVSDLSDDKPKKIIKPKYKIIIDDEEYTWTGRGRIPTVFKNVKDQLEKYLIRE